MAKNKILIVDDEPGIRFGIRDYLETQGLEVQEAESCRDAYAVFLTFCPDAAIIDYRLGDGTALELLPRLKEIDSSVPLIVLTAYSSIDLAVQAVKEGAEQFLTKPIELPALLVVLRRLLDQRRLRRKQQAGATREIRQQVDPFVGTSAAIRELEAHARKVVATDRPLLIQGETGTGKNVLAAWLHRHGPRGDESFVDLNCAGLSREFLETELFGHEKGAFTGAVAAKQGLLEVAHAGTLFLDEIGDVDPGVQPKLLKVLEEKRFRRLGDVRDREVDVSLIAATHQNLKTLVREGKFRADLYFRISTIPLTVPPLRERREDIALLATGLLGRFAAEMGRGELRLAPEAEVALQRYAWPGNIRELKNVLERAILMCSGNQIRRQDLRFDAVTEQEFTATDTGLTLKEVEKAHIERVLTEEQGKVEQAAQRLGIPRSSLYHKIKMHGIAISKV